MSGYLSRADAVRRLIPKGDVQTIAVGMVGCGPHAADYILQAPVLALAATWSSPHVNFHAARNNACRLFAERIASQPKLRELMASYNVAYAFRALRKSALAKSNFRAIIAIGQADGLHPSALAQAIPEKPVDQARWLRSIEAFASKIDGRSHRLGYRDIIAWPTVAFSRPAVADAISSEEASDLADFFLSDPGRWNPKWTYEQARQAERRWHEELAQRRNDQALHQRFGLRFTDMISYAPLPLEFETKGLRFVALDSGEALFEEGCAMHHCVSTYVGEVVGGLSRIYSIREGERRVATLELEPLRGIITGGLYHHMRQLRGPYNAPPSSEIVDAAIEFVGHLNEAGRAAKGLAA